MLSKKRLVGAALGAAAVGTRVGREQIGKIVAAVRGRLGGGSRRDTAAIPPGASAADLPPEQRQDFAAKLPPTPGTVAVAVGAPNAPDLDVIAGEHDAEHRDAD